MLSPRRGHRCEQYSIVCPIITAAVASSAAMLTRGPAKSSFDGSSDGKAGFPTCGDDISVKADITSD